jgi:hypothetical protein
MDLAKDFSQGMGLQVIAQFSPDLPAKHQATSPGYDAFRFGDDKCHS